MQESNKRRILDDFFREPIDLKAYSYNFRSDKEFVLAAIKDDENNYSYIAPELLEDKDFVIKLIQVNFRVLYQMTNSKFLKDKDFNLSLIDSVSYQNRDNLFEYINSNFQEDIDILLKKISYDAHYASKYSDDKEFMLKAIEVNSDVIEYIGEKLKKDKDFALTVLQKYPLYLRCFDQALKKDKDVMRAAASKDPFVLQYADIEILRDKEFISPFLIRKPSLLQFLSKDIKGDKELILFIIKMQPEIFKYVDLKLKKDKEFVLTCININPFILQHAALSLRRDKEVVLAAINLNPLSLGCVDVSLRMDKKVVKSAVDKNCVALGDAHISVRNDKDFVVPILDKDPLAFEYAGPDIRNDYDIAKFVIEKNPYAILYVGHYLKYDESLVIIALKNDLDVAKKLDRAYLTKNIISCIDNPISLQKRNDKEAMRKAVNENWLNIIYASSELRADKEFILYAYNENVNSAQFIAEDLSNDIEFAKELILLDSTGIPFFPKQIQDKLLNDKEFAKEVIASDPDGIKFFSTDVRYDKEIIILVYKREFASDLLNKLKEKYYEAYKKQIVLKYPQRDNDYDFLNIMLSSQVLEKICESNEYTVNDLKFIEKFVQENEVHLKVEISHRMEKLKEINLKRSQAIYYELSDAVNDDVKFETILNKYNLSKDTIIDFIINNKYYNPEIKQNFIRIVKTHYKTGIVTVGDVFNMLYDMVENELTIDQILELKGINKSLFYILYKNAMEDNPILYDFIKNKLGENKIRGMKKFFKKGFAILKYKTNSLAEIEEKFGEDVYMILENYQRTELYDKLYAKFSVMPGFDINVEKEEPSKGIK